MAKLLRGTFRLILGVAVFWTAAWLWPVQPGLSFVLLDRPLWRAILPGVLVCLLVAVAVDRLWLRVRRMGPVLGD